MDINKACASLRYFSEIVGTTMTYAPPMMMQVQAHYERRREARKPLMLVDPRSANDDL